MAQHWKGWLFVQEAVTMATLAFYFGKAGTSDV